MTDPVSYRQLLGATLAALLIGAAAIAGCYFLVDQPVAFLVRDSRLPDHAGLKWLTYPPPVIQAWAPVVLAGLFVRRAWGPWRGWERAVLAAGVAVILADEFRQGLGYGFGRTWPGTWVDDNPSLLRDGAYGFHPFHGGEGYMSFPSGHTARAVAAAAPFWAGYPGWRWACALAVGLVAVGLIGMNYHFVSDVIAGGLVGGVVGAYVAAGCGVGAGEGGR